MTDTIKTGDLIINSTTKDLSTVTIPDVDYVYVLALKDLTHAINALANAMRSR